MAATLQLAGTAESDALISQEFRLVRVIQQFLLDADSPRVSPTDAQAIRTAFLGTRFALVLEDPEFGRFLDGEADLSGEPRRLLSALCSRWTHEEVVALTRDELRQAEEREQQTGDSKESERLREALQRYEQAEETRRAKANTIQALDVQAALEKLDRLRLVEPDSARRALLQDAWRFLFHRREMAEVRLPEWRRVLTELDALLAKQAGAFENAADALHQIGEVAGEEIAHCRNPAERSIEHQAELERAAVTLKGLPDLVRTCLARLGKVGGGRPALDELAHVEAVLSGALTRIRANQRAIGAFTFEEIAEFNFDGQGVNARLGQSMKVEGAKRVRERVNRYVQRKTAELDPVHEALLELTARSVPGDTKPDPQ